VEKMFLLLLPLAIKQIDFPLISKHWIPSKGHQVWNIPLATKLWSSPNSFLPLFFKGSNLDHFSFSFQM
jgi:hypothetical protein